MLGHDTMTPSNGAGKINIHNYSKFSNFQAAIGIKQLRLLERRIKKRMKNARILDKHLDERIKRQTTTKNGRHVYLNYSVELENRKEVREKLLLAGVYSQTTWLKSCSSRAPASNRLKDTVLYLPINEKMGKSSMKDIAKRLNDLSL